MEFTWSTSANINLFLDVLDYFNWSIFLVDHSDWHLLVFHSLFYISTGLISDQFSLQLFHAKKTKSLADDEQLAEYFAISFLVSRRDNYNYI